MLPQMTVSQEEPDKSRNKEFISTRTTCSIKQEIHAAMGKQAG